MSRKPTNSKSAIPALRPKKRRSPVLGHRMDKLENLDGGADKAARISRRRNPASPKLSEKAKKLALKAFQKTYEAHHGKRS